MNLIMTNSDGEKKEVSMAELLGISAIVPSESELDKADFIVKLAEGLTELGVL